MAEESRSRQVIKFAERLPSLPDLSFRIGNYRKVYGKAKYFYKKEWKGNEKKSPAFGKIVRATSHGWNHLVGKTITTNYKDAIKRLNHLPNAKQIIERSEVIYETTKEVDKRGLIINRHCLMGKLENGQILKVVVKEIGEKLIFNTVYSSGEIKKMAKKHEL
ncbi:MAG: hypothetical protein ABIG64_03965 [Candidatus Omnitrophota bacterium]